MGPRADVPSARHDGPEKQQAPCRRGVAAPLPKALRRSRDTEQPLERDLGLYDDMANAYLAMACADKARA